jgi:hypothetical protein
MRRKKKLKKKKLIPTPLPETEEELITSLLQEFGDCDPCELASRIPDPRLAKVLVERLPLDNEFSIRLMSEIDDHFKDNKVHKSIKRALFKLEKRGVSVELFHGEDNRSSAILKPPERDEPIAYLGPVDGIGSRALVIVLDRSMKGLDIGMGVVSDEHGIQEFLFGNLSRKRTKETIDQLAETAGPLVEASLSHAVTIVENSYQRHLELHPEAPADYLELRPWLLENVTLLNRPVIFEYMPEISFSDGILTDSQIHKLFQHRLMESWLIDFESLKPFMEDIEKLEKSPIFLSGTQKADQAREIKKKGMEELFPTVKRALLKHRLEETAYIFFKLDEAEYSKLCLYAGKAMDQEDTTLRANPIIEHLFDRSLNFYLNSNHGVVEEESREDDTSSSIIVP